MIPREILTKYRQTILSQYSRTQIECTHSEPKSNIFAHLWGESLVQNADKLAAFKMTDSENGQKKSGNQKEIQLCVLVHSSTKKFHLFWNLLPFSC